MKRITVIACLAGCMSCRSSIKLVIPTTFTDQATQMKVSGARSKTMSFGKFKTSKIKRGWETRGGHYGKRYFLDNLLLNRLGIQKNEIISKKKDKFHYTITDGTDTAEIFSKESEIHKNLNFKIGNGNGFLENINRLQYYQYLFTSTIFVGDSTNKAWEMILTNIYDRKKDTTNKLFTIIRDTNSGVATNGTDSIFIRPLNIRKTESPDGKQGKFPIELLAGYELRMDGGVVAVINGVDKDIWFYKELDDHTRLILAAISAAILAKRIKDVKW
jgi:hypothetical protein